MPSSHPKLGGGFLLPTVVLGAQGSSTLGCPNCGCPTLWDLIQNSKLLSSMAHGVDGGMA